MNKFDDLKGRFMSLGTKMTQSNKFEDRRRTFTYNTFLLPKNTYQTWYLADLLQFVMEFFTTSLRTREASGKQYEHCVVCFWLGPV